MDRAVVVDDVGRGVAGDAGSVVLVVSGLQRVVREVVVGDALVVVVSSSKHPLM